MTFENICAMCVANVSEANHTWFIIVMLILMLAIFIVINANRNSNRHTFYAHTKIPCTQMYSDMNVKSVEESSNVIIIWW